MDYRDDRYLLSLDGTSHVAMPITTPTHNMEPDIYLGMCPVVATHPLHSFPASPPSGIRLHTQTSSVDCQITFLHLIIVNQIDLLVNP